MSRRGKDDGFHPHPGDPWHPGWSSDDEPIPAEEAPVAGTEDWADVLGVRPEEPSLPDAAPREPEPFAPSLFDWREGGPLPPGTSSETMRVPAEGVEDRERESEPRVEAGVEASEETGEPPVAMSIPAEEADEGEGEAEDWLAFAAGSSGAGGGEAPEAGALPGGEEAAGAIEGPAAPGPRAARWWPFGRRRAPAEPEGEPGPAWPAPAGEQPGEPLPPPWSPDLGWEEDRPVPIPVIPGPLSGERPETKPLEGGELPVEEPAGEPMPPPWAPQADLDRPVAVPVIPGPLSGEGPESEPADGGWGEEEWAEEAWAEFAGWEVPAGDRPSPGEGEGPPSAVPGVAGAPTAEMPAPALFDFARPAAPGGLLGEESFTGAVTSEHRHLAAEVAAADTAEAELQALSAPMPGLESGVVGFEDVVYLGGEEELAEPTGSDLPIRVVTGLVLVGILLGSLWVGGELLAALVGALALFALGEFYGTLRHTGYVPLAAFGFLGATGLLVGTWFLGLVAIPVAVIGVTVVCFLYYSFASRRREPFTNGSLTLLGLLWVAGTLAFAFPIAAAPDFRVLILAAAATVVATDVGAFFAGRSWGSRPLAPVLSPHKTVEGLAGGVVLGIAVAVVLGHFLEPLNIRIGAALGLVVVVMAPLGDLAESMVKRSLGVKDMGSILPGHGGILDRIDAFLFVLPAVWVLYETLGLLR